MIVMPLQQLQQFYTQRTMKEGLIESRVNKLTDLSQKIKDFIQEKTTNRGYPFQQEEFQSPNPKIKARAKRSLTDWRQLYSRNQNKIVPQHSVYPATADGQRFRKAMTRQGDRRRVYSTVKSKSFQGERDFQTRQSRRQKLNETKRQSMVEFAFAQNIYQNQIFKDQPRTSTRDKRFYFPKQLDSKREDYHRVGQYLSLAQGCPSEAQVSFDATQEYIRRQQKERVNFKVNEYNKVKIREDQKINNSRFYESLQLMNRKKKKMQEENGLRFYQRA